MGQVSEQITMDPRLCIHVGMSRKWGGKEMEKSQWQHQFHKENVQGAVWAIMRAILVELGDEGVNTICTTKRTNQSGPTARPFAKDCFKFHFVLSRINSQVDLRSTVTFLGIMVKS